MILWRKCIIRSKGWEDAPHLPARADLTAGAFVVLRPCPGPRLRHGWNCKTATDFSAIARGIAMILWRKCIIRSKGWEDAPHLPARADLTAGAFVVLRPCPGPRLRHGWNCKTATDFSASDRFQCESDLGSAPGQFRNLKAVRRRHRVSPLLTGCS